MILYWYVKQIKNFLSWILKKIFEKIYENNFIFIFTWEKCIHVRDLNFSEVKRYESRRIPYKVILFKFYESLPGYY